MFASFFRKSALASVILAGSMFAMGCVENVIQPSAQGNQLPKPCAPGPDLVRDGMIDDSDLREFDRLAPSQDLSADLTGNGVVNEFDRRIVEYFLGQVYAGECGQMVTLHQGCSVHASPDMNGNGYIDASDLAAFHAAKGNPSAADFNADGVVDVFDEIILGERLGERYTTTHYANVDMNGDGKVDASDLAYFAAIGNHPSADFTHNGVVDDLDRQILEYMLGRNYSPTCGSTPVYVLAEGCTEYASLDITGDGWVDASDIAMFNSGIITLADGDFNGDGIIDTLDELLLLDHLGKPNLVKNCSEAS